jgi:hypothetical protein
MNYMKFCLVAYAPWKVISSIYPIKVYNLISENNLEFSFSNKIWNLTLATNVLYLKINGKKDDSHTNSPPNSNSIMIHLQQNGKVSPCNFFSWENYSFTT